MKDGKKVKIEGVNYFYDANYDRLESKKDDKPAIACPKCHNTTFKISYSRYECIANCRCGHQMTIYDG